mmetsp:Transcript_97249/g.208636  ORF Transcript_97249/g.208636 Transcript_97249/m.208636 type:complete len:220 (+) Transcript_97249:3167-3826(+)
MLAMEQPSSPARPPGAQIFSSLVRLPSISSWNCPTKPSRDSFPSSGRVAHQEAVALQCNELMYHKPMAIAIVTFASSQWCWACTASTAISTLSQYSAKKFVMRTSELEYRGASAALAKAIFSAQASRWRVWASILRSLPYRSSTMTFLWTTFPASRSMTMSIICVKTPSILKLSRFARSALGTRALASTLVQMFVWEAPMRTTQAPRKHLAMLGFSYSP